MHHTCTNHVSTTLLESASKNAPYVYNHVSKTLLASASNNAPHMYQSCINKSNYDSSRCTNLTIPYTSCMCQLINYMFQHVSQPYTNITNKIPLSIHHTIHDPNTINPYIKPCVKTSLLCSLKCVPIIYQDH
jgi:hypothetical protein